MSDDQDSAAHPPAKKPPMSLKELLGRRVKYDSEIGPLFLHSPSTSDCFALRDLMKTTEPDDHALGIETMRLAASRSETALDQPLTADELRLLAPGPLAVHVLKAIGVAPQDSDTDIDPAKKLGGHMREQIHSLVQATEKMNASFSSLTDGLKSQMAANAFTIDQAARNLKELGTPRFHPTSMSEIRVPPLNIERGDARLVRKSEETIEKLEQIATNLALLGEGLTSQIKLITEDIAPRWERQAEEAGQTAGRALKAAWLSVVVASIALILSALVPYHIEQMQERAGEAEARAQAEHRERLEDLQIQQLQELKAMAEQQRQSREQGAREALPQPAASPALPQPGKKSKPSAAR